MPSQHGLQLAIKYASRVRQIGLAERLSDIARRKAAEEAARQQGLVEEENEEEEEGEDFRSALDAGCV